MKKKKTPTEMVLLRLAAERLKDVQNILASGREGLLSNRVGGLLNDLKSMLENSEEDKCSVSIPLSVPPVVVTAAMEVAPTLVEKSDASVLSSVRPLTTS